MTRIFNEAFDALVPSSLFGRRNPHVAREILKRAFFIPGYGAFLLDTEFDSRDSLLVLANNIAAKLEIFHGMSASVAKKDSPVLLEFESRMLSEAEARIDFPVSVLSDIVDISDAETANGNAMRKTLFRMVGVFLRELRYIKAETFSAADAKLFSCAALCGAIDSNLTAPPAFFHFLSRAFEKVFRSSVPNKSANPGLASRLLVMMFFERRFLGAARDDTFAESFRNGEPENDGMGGRFIAAVASTKQRILEMCGMAASELVRSKIPSAKLVRLMTGYRPVSPAFWLDEKLFGGKCPRDVSLEFGGKYGSPLSSLAGKLFNDGFLSFREAEELDNLGECLTGRLDLALGRRSPSAVSRNGFLGSEIDVATPFETEGFFDRLEKLASESFTGRLIRDAFAFSCVEAFGASKIGYDLVSFSNNGTPEIGVSDDNARKLAATIYDACVSAEELHPEYGDFASIPCSARIASYPLPDGRILLEPLVKRGLEKGNGRLAFRDAVALAALLRERTVTDALLESGRSPAVLLEAALEGILAADEDIEPPKSRLCNIEDFSKWKMTELALDVFTGAVRTFAETEPEYARSAVLSAAKKIEAAGRTVFSVEKARNELFDEYHDGEFVDGLSLSEMGVPDLRKALVELGEFAGGAEVAR